MVNSGNAVTLRKLLPAVVLAIAFGLIKILAKPVIGGGLYLFLLNGLIVVTLLHLVITLAAINVRGAWQQLPVRIKQVNFQLGLLAGTLFFC